MNIYLLSLFPLINIGTKQQNWQKLPLCNKTTWLKTLVKFECCELFKEIKWTINCNFNNYYRKVKRIIKKWQEKAWNTLWKVMMSHNWAIKDMKSIINIMAHFDVIVSNTLLGAWILLIIIDNFFHYYYN